MHNGYVDRPEREARARAHARRYFLIGLITGLIVGAALIVGAVFGYLLISPAGQEFMTERGNRTLVIRTTPRPTAVPEVRQATAAPDEAADAVPTEKPVTAADVLFGGTTLAESAQSGVYKPVTAAQTAAPVAWTVLENGLTTDVPLGLAASDRVSNATFNKTLVIGDEAITSVQKFVAAQRKKSKSYFGKARFLTAEGLTSGALLEEVSATSLHPVYNKKKRPVEEAAASMGAQTVVIATAPDRTDTMLAVDNTMRLIDRIGEKLPKARIVVLSATARVEGNGQEPSANAIFDYNVQLCNRCAAVGIDFVDPAYALRGADGYLPQAACQDPEKTGRLLTADAAKVWVDYLYTHWTQAE